MNYLAISKSTDYLALANFKDKTLVSFDKITFKDFEERKIVKHIYDEIAKNIDEYKVGVVLTHAIEMSDVSKKKLKAISSQRAIIQLACFDSKVAYIEVRTDGWEQYITSGRNTLKRKLDIINKGYGLELKYNKKNFLKGEQEIADAIILGEAMAHGRLHL